MEGRLIKRLQRTPFTNNPLSTYNQRTFNSAIGIKSPVQAQLFGFTGVGVVPGGLAQGSTPPPPGQSYFDYIGGDTYFQIIGGEEYYVVT